jgi:hypothetical protein
MLVGAEIDWIALNAWDLSKYFEFISIDVEDGEAKFRATELLNEVTKKK